MVASGSDDETIKIWDIEKGLLKTFEGHTSSVNSVSWSQNALLIASGSDDKTIKIWDIETGLLKTFEGHTSCVNSVFWSQNALLIASGSYDNDNAIKIWNVSDMCSSKLKFVD